jgi:membrane protein
LFLQTIKKGFADDIPRLGAALAFYGILSIVPMLALLLWAAAPFYGTDVAGAQIYDLVRQFSGPEEAATIQNMLKASAHYAQTAGGMAVVNFAILFFGASGVFTEMQDGLNLIWKKSLKQKPTIVIVLKEHVVSLIMVVAIAFLLIVSVLFDAALGMATRVATGIVPSLARLAQAGNLFATFCVMASVLSFTFKMLPDENIAWRDVWAGAVITGFLFTLGRFLIGFYLAHATVIAGYGEAGSLVALMIWAYYSAQLFFFGAEFTHLYAHRFGSLRQTEDINANREARHLSPESSRL